MKRKVLMLFGMVLFLVACGRASQSSSGEISVDELKSAKAIWQQTIGTLGESVLNGGVGVSSGVIFGVSANSDKGTIAIWNWDGKQFGYGSELSIMSDWCGDACTWGIDSAQVLDLTGEGDDDVFVGYHLNDSDGAVFSEVLGMWKAVDFDLGLYGAEVVGTIVKAYHEPCLPSCADGGAIPISYTWDGNQFIGSAVDDYGNKFTPLIGPSCSTFTPNDYEPYKVCDKGEGIRYLQQVLQDSGLLYSTSNNPVDGYFGPETEYSIKVYQYQNQLPVDGMVEGQWYRDLIENYNLINGYVG
jgi:hypothetical protein